MAMVATVLFSHDDLLHFEASMETPPRVDSGLLRGYRTAKACYSDQSSVRQLGPQGEH